MKWMVFVLIALTAVTGVVAATALSSRPADEAAAAIAGGTLPPGYRDWRLISVAREEAELDDIRAVLGNDVAIRAYRDGARPFPDGAVIARLAWSYVPSEDNNKAFGKIQSFVAGSPKKASSSWSRTRPDTPRPAAGGTRSLMMSCP